MYACVFKEENRCVKNICVVYKVIHSRYILIFIYEYCIFIVVKQLVQSCNLENGPTS